MLNVREKLIDLLEEYIEVVVDLTGEPTIEVNYGECAAELIANGMTVQRWIPVTERLPEKNTDVLVYNGDYIFVSEYYTKQFGSIEVDMWRKPQCSDDPTHWMSIPTPPKDGDGE